MVKFFPEGRSNEPIKDTPPDKDILKGFGEPLFTEKEVKKTIDVIREFLSSWESK